MHLLTFRSLSVCDVKQRMSAVRSRCSRFVWVSVITIGSRVLSEKLIVGQLLKNSIQPAKVHEGSLLSSQDPAMVSVLTQMKPVHTLLPGATQPYNRRKPQLYSNNALFFLQVFRFEPIYNLSCHSQASIQKPFISRP